MYEYFGKFDGSVDTGNTRPADVVPHFLAGPNKETATMRIKQLEDWYREYVDVRCSPNLFKGCKSFVLASFYHVYFQMHNM